MRSTLACGKHLFAALALTWVCAGAAASELRHFLYTGSDELASIEPLLQRPDIEGVQIVYSWKSLEPEPGRYDFSGIERDLAYLQQRKKQLFVQVQDRFFLPTARLYAKPGAMHSAFAQFLSIPQDAEDNQKSLPTKLTMPVLAIGGEKSFGPNEAIVMRNAATNVQELVVPNAGHWLMEEQPQATVSAIVKFLAQ